MFSSSWYVLSISLCFANPSRSCSVKCFIYYVKALPFWLIGQVIVVKTHSSSQIQSLYRHTFLKNRETLLLWLLNLFFFFFVSAGEEQSPESASQILRLVASLWWPRFVQTHWTSFWIPVLTPEVSRWYRACQAELKWKGCTTIHRRRRGFCFISQVCVDLQDLNTSTNPSMKYATVWETSFTKTRVETENVWFVSWWNYSSWVLWLSWMIQISWVRVESFFPRTWI